MGALHIRWTLITALRALKTSSISSLSRGNESAPVRVSRIRSPLTIPGFFNTRSDRVLAAAWIVGSKRLWRERQVKISCKGRRRHGYITERSDRVLYTRRPIARIAAGRKAGSPWFMPRYNTGSSFSTQASTKSQDMSLVEVRMCARVA